MDEEEEKKPENLVSGYLFFVNLGAPYQMQRRKACHVGCSVDQGTRGAISAGNAIILLGR